jgi:phosphoesterase RecJ-like protein
MQNFAVYFLAGPAFMKNTPEIQALQQLLETPKDIVITTHHKPDADALGSSLGMAGYLKKKGHQVTVIPPTDYPSFLNWMPGNDDVLIFTSKSETEVRARMQKADVIFCLDFSALSRINELGEIVQASPATKVLIDHHMHPENFAQIMFSNTNAAATCELIFEVIKGLGDEALIDKEIGECLYAGIMTDTGSFRHPSTSRNVHLIIAELISIGVNTAKVHRLIYDNHTLTRLRFLGYALKDKLVVHPEYNTAYIAITQEELKQFDSKTGDTEGLVNFALSIEGIVFAALIIDRGQAIKISFRSVGDFSVNDFARNHFHGGGHHNAAGGISFDSLPATLAKFESLLPQYSQELIHSA